MQPQDVNHKSGRKGLDLEIVYLQREVAEDDLDMVLLCPYTARACKVWSEMEEAHNFPGQLMAMLYLGVLSGYLPKVRVDAERLTR